MLATIERDGVNAIAIVRDAFAKPMLRALDASHDKYDISSLVMISRSGVMFSEESKHGRLRHHPGMMIADALSSSEPLGMGPPLSTAGGPGAPPQCTAGEHPQVTSHHKPTTDA